MRYTLLLFLVACGAGQDGREAVEAAGMTDVVIEGVAPMSCGKGDDFNSHFTATNPQGKRVSGVVCCGWLKGCTVRF